MISCRHLNISKSDRDLIENLNLELQVGEFWAVLGRNGAGKSSLLHTLAGLEPHSIGQVLVDQFPLGELSHLLRAQKLGFMSQLHEPQLDGSVRQMVSFGRYPWHQLAEMTENDEHLIDSALEFVELRDRQHENTQLMSGGEQRKVELATVLAQDSKVFLFDEPMNHMDLSFKIKFLRYMQKLQLEKLIVMVTHDVHFVQKYCSHVLILNTETDWQAGPVSQVLTDENISKYLQTDMKDIYE